jgi:hypothetical protein
VFGNRSPSIECKSACKYSLPATPASKRGNEGHANVGIRNPNIHMLLAHIAAVSAVMKNIVSFLGPIQVELPCRMYYRFFIPSKSGRRYFWNMFTQQCAVHMRCLYDKLYGKETEIPSISVTRMQTSSYTPIGQRSLGIDYGKHYRRSSR